MINVLKIDCGLIVPSGNLRSTRGVSVGYVGVLLGHKQLNQNGMTIMVYKSLRVCFTETHVIIKSCSLHLTLSYV